ncbi:MAG: hypothetical protein ACERKZ_00685 [Lachnotalea sp.]
MINVTIRGTVEYNPNDLAEYIRGEQNAIGCLQGYKTRFSKQHIFVSDIFCKLGYGQNANSSSRSGYLALFDFLNDFENKNRETQYKKDVERLLNCISLEEARNYIKEIDFNGNIYPSQQWHYLIAYTKWKKVLGKKCGKNFACAELLVYLYEVINDIPSISLILNTCIRGKDERVKFVKNYNNSENSLYIMNINEATYLIEID